MIKKTKQSNFIVKGTRTPLTAMSYINQVVIITTGLSLVSALAFTAFSNDSQSMSFVLAEINHFHKDILGEKFVILATDVVNWTSIITITNYGTESSILAILSDTGQELECTTNNTDNSDFVVPTDQVIEVTCIDLTGSTKFYVVTETRQILEALP